MRGHPVSSQARARAMAADGGRLAWCELYMVFAMLFRTFEMEAVDTT